MFKLLVTYIQIFLLCAVFFTLPLSPKLNAIVVTLLTLFSFFGAKEKRNKHFFLLNYIFPGFYLIHVLSGFFSDNMDFFLKDLEIKLSFLIVPIVFYNLSVSLFKKRNLYLLFYLFGVLVSSVLCYMKSQECFNEFKVRACNESSNLAFGFHPTYISLYYILAIVILWVLISSYIQKNKWLLISLGICGTVYLLFFIYKFYALGPWISFVFMLCSFIVYLGVSKGRVFQVVLFFSGLAGLCVVSVNKMDLLASEYKVVKNELTEYVSSPEAYLEKNKDEITSVKARVIIWSISVKLVGENLMGVGAGDVKDVLINRYKTEGLNNYVNKKLNCHNQFLQTSLALGIVVGALLFLCLFLFFIFAIKNENILLVALITLLGSSMLFESILERQAGIIFFMFFIYMEYNRSSLKCVEDSKKEVGDK